MALYFSLRCQLVRNKETIQLKLGGRCYGNAYTPLPIRANHRFLFIIADRTPVDLIFIDIPGKADIQYTDRIPVAGQFKTE